MSTKSYKWIQIPYEVYRSIFQGMGSGSMQDKSGNWGVFSTYTSCNEYMDQMTEWGISSENEPLLKNESYRGNHSYYIAYPQSPQE